MKALRIVMWAETAILLALLVAFIADAISGRELALGVAALAVLFAIPAFMLIAEEQAQAGSAHD